MKLSIIAAVDLNNAIGKDNALPWRLPADLANFKALTSGHNVIMGGKTWESLGNNPLPNRGNLVITRYPERYAKLSTTTDDRLVTFHTSIDAALNALKRIEIDTGKEQEVFIIGGGEIYRQLLPKADTVYLSRIELKVEDADAFFPEISRDEFQLDFSIRHLRDGLKNTHDWHYQIWNRIGSGAFAGTVTDAKLEFTK